MLARQPGGFSPQLGCVAAHASSGRNLRGAAALVLSLLAAIGLGSSVGLAQVNSFPQRFPPTQPNTTFPQSFGTPVSTSTGARESDTGWPPQSLPPSRRPPSSSVGGHSGRIHTAQLSRPRNEEIAEAPFANESLLSSNSPPEVRPASFATGEQGSNFKNPTSSQLQGEPSIPGQDARPPGTLDVARNTEFRRNRSFDGSSYAERSASAPITYPMLGPDGWEGPAGHSTLGEVLRPQGEESEGPLLLDDVRPGERSYWNWSNWQNWGRVPDCGCEYDQEYRLIGLPDQILYQSYLAGPREPRFAGLWVHDPGLGWRWEVTLGGRAGILRYGTSDPHWPEGFQIDIEGGAFVRLNLDFQNDVEATDYRFGVPFTYRSGPWETKFAYYHISSHLIDEFIERFPDVQRNNYARDALVLGLAYRYQRDLRIYGEIGWAFATFGPAEPWELQFGFEYSPRTPTGLMPTPFFAVNTRLREEVDWGGNITVQGGVQWVGRSGHTFRLAAHYLNGATPQVIFLGDNEQQVGFGLLYDY